MKGGNVQSVILFGDTKEMLLDVVLIRNMKIGSREKRTMKKEQKIKVMEVFIERHTKKEIAEFIVNLDDSLHGLQANMGKYREEFKKLYKEKEE